MRIFLERIPGKEKVQGKRVGLFFLLLLLPAMGLAQTVAAQLLSEWRMDESKWSGIQGEVQDIQGRYSGYSRTRKGATYAQPSAAKLCNGGSFTGNSNSYLVLPSINSDFSQGVSAAAWVKAAATGLSGEAIIDLARGNSYDNIYFSRAGTGSALRFGVYNGTSSCGFVDSSTGALDGNFHHFAATLDRLKNVKIYRDGAQIGSGALSCLPQSGITRTSNAVARSRVTANRFTGVIDELKLWSGTLTQTEIQNGYANESAGNGWAGTSRSCTPWATKVAEYRFEESLTWAGTAAEIKDLAGGASSPYHGVAVTPYPVQGDSLPARTGNPGTCDYGNLNGGAFDFNPASGLPSSNGSYASVSFWMRWDGSDGVVPLGWSTYGLMLKNNFFGFTTNNSNDIYGISSVGLSGGWHHIAALFAIGSPTASRLYLDGVQQTLSQKQGTGSAANAKVTGTLRLGGLAGSSLYRMSGSVDDLQVFSGAFDVEQISALYNELRTCPSLMLKYNMNESIWSGADSVLDSSGNGHPGTPSGKAVPRACGGSGVGDFRAGGVVDAGTDTDFSPQTGSREAITVGGWVKAEYASLTANTLAGGNYQAIVSKLSNTSGAAESEWILHVTPSSSYFDMYLNNGNSYANWTRPLWSGDTFGTCQTTTAYVACWHFVAYTFDYLTSTATYYALRPDTGDMANAAAAGVREDSYSWSLAQSLGAPDDGTSGNLRVGVAALGVSEPLTGALKGIFVAEGAYSKAKLRALANATWPGQCGNQTFGPSALYAVDNGADAVNGKIGTKVTGSSFLLDVSALNAGKTAKDTGFTGDVAVDLLANTSAGIASDANNCPLSSASNISVGTATLVSGAKIALSVPAVTESYRDVAVRVRYPATGAATVTACSDHFAIRPNNLSLSFQDFNATQAGTARTLNNLAVPGGVVHKAGQPFRVTASAYKAGASPTISPLYDGTAALSLSSCAAVAPDVCPSAATLGALSIGSLAFAAGQAASSTVSYPEVGAFSAQLIDTGFADIDKDDGTPATCAGRWICSDVVNVGRFVPDHFTVTAGTARLRTDISCTGVPTFNYYDEDFSTSFTLVAQSASPSASTTVNYAGKLDQLKPLLWDRLVFTASGLPASVTLSPGSGSAVGTFDKGVASVTQFHRLASAASPATPAAISIATAPVDADGVSLAISPVVLATPTFKQGRVRMLNAQGAELLDLPVSLRTESWSGTSTGWVIETADSCSTASVSLIDGKKLKGTASFGAAQTCVLNNATACSTLRAGRSFTGAAQAGQFNLWLRAPGYGNSGYLTVTATVPDYFKFNWTGSVSLPSARATFGLRKSSPVTFRREISSH
jgi:hypothetical protein